MMRGKYPVSLPGSGNLFVMLRHLERDSGVDGRAPHPVALVLSGIVLVALLRGAMTGAERATSWTLLLPCIVVLSVVWNFGVPLAYLSWRRRVDPVAFVGLRPVTDYASGMVGDAVILPLLNVALLVFLRALPNAEHPRLACGAVAFGAVITAVLHIGQARFRLINWSMPQPGRWNFAGQWHLVSAPAQFAIVCYGVGAALLASPPTRLGNAGVLAGIATLLCLFLATAFMDYRAELGAVVHWLQATLAARLSNLTTVGQKS